MTSPSSDSGRGLARANSMWLKKIVMSLVYPCIAWLEIAYHMTMIQFAEDLLSNKHLHLTLIVLVNL